MDGENETENADLNWRFCQVLVQVSANCQNWTCLVLLQPKNLELLQLFDLHGSGKNSEGKLWWTSSVVNFENFLKWRWVTVAESNGKLRFEENVLGFDRMKYDVSFLSNSILNLKYKETEFSWIQVNSIEFSFKIKRAISLCLSVLLLFMVHGFNSE